MQVCPQAIDAYLAPLERMFETVEAKTEEQAHVAALTQALRNAAEQEKSNARNKSSSRRTSISISRLGQFDDVPKSAQGIPTPKRVSSIALQPLFYQAQVKSESVDSFASLGDREDSEQHTEDHHHVTQMRSIAGKQSISKTVGGLLPRRLSRSRSGILISPPNVVIGVSVQESTVETQEEHDDQNRTTVQASGLHHRSSETNMNKLGSNGWLSKAKGLTQKITGRARSKSSAGYEAS